MMIYIFICLIRFKNFREVFDGYKHHVAQDGDKCTLVVNNVVSDDCGEVECRAFNKAGTATLRANLNLQGITPKMFKIR